MAELPADRQEKEKGTDLMIKALAAAALGIGLFSSHASAATVSTNNSVSFEFDTTLLTGSLEITGASWRCQTGCLGSANTNPNYDLDNFLQQNKSFKWNFGTTLGGSELGSKTFKLLGLVRASAFSGSLNPAPGNTIQSITPASFLPLAGSVNTVFVTFEHVDDLFQVNKACFSYNTPGRSPAFAKEICSSSPQNIASNSSPSPVPLPASLPLVVSGFGLLAWLRRRKEQ